MIYKFFDKNSEGSGVNIPLEFNGQLVKDLHKPIIKNFKKEQFIWDLNQILNLGFKSVRT